MDLNLQKYFAPLMHSWWLVALAAVISTITAYVIIGYVPPVYQARTTLLIGSTLSDPNPRSEEFSISYQLAREYASVAMREPVAEATKASLNMLDLPEYEARPSTIFLVIVVTHTDPVLAQKVANELARQLIILSPSTQYADPEKQSFIGDQLKEMQLTIEDTRSQIRAKQDELAIKAGAVELANTETEIKVLTEKLLTLQNIYANLYASSQDAAQNTLSVFEPAGVPSVPIGPNKIIILALAMVSGFVLGVGAAYLLEFLDDTIKSEDELVKLTGYPILGRISVLSPDMSKSNVATHPLSREADAFRTLRTNLEFSSVDRRLKRILLLSAGAAEGKTTIAANFATSLTQTEKRVILVDGDLRAPAIHKIMMIPEKPGLGDLFIERTTYDEALVKSQFDERLSILPAGTTPPNATELLGSQRMDKILDDLQDRADMLILDGPPIFIADSLVLSTKVDGVLVVVDYGQTKRDALRSLSGQLERVQAKVIGVVMNRVPPSMFYGRYYNRYYGNKGSKRSQKDTSPKESSLKPTRKTPAVKEQAVRESSSKRQVEPRKISLPKINFKKANLITPAILVERFVERFFPPRADDQEYLSKLAQKKRGLTEEDRAGLNAIHEVEPIGVIGNLPDQSDKISISVESSPSTLVHADQDVSNEGFLSDDGNNGDHRLDQEDIVGFVSQSSELESKTDKISGEASTDGETEKRNSKGGRTKRGRRI
jgi:capsular exopolysaccharide synthesis family protein